MILHSLLKSTLSMLAYPFGLDVVWAPRKQIVPEIIPDRHCYSGPEDFSLLYRPWLSDQYTSFFTPQILQNTMLNRQKLYFLKQMLENALHLGGDIFEAGAGSGGSGRLMLETQKLNHTTRTLWLLDTFEGYQKIDPGLDGKHVAVNGCRCNSAEDVVRLMADPSIPSRIVKGLIPQTLAEVSSTRLCFAHIDVNLYEPTFAATRFCLDRLETGGIVVFDDYCWPATYGARSAIDAVCLEYGQEIVCLPESTQAFLIKREKSK